VFVWRLSVMFFILWLLLVVRFWLLVNVAYFLLVYRLIVSYVCCFLLLMTTNKKIKANKSSMKLNENL